MKNLNSFLTSNRKVLPVEYSTLTDEDFEEKEKKYKKTQNMINSRLFNYNNLGSENLSPFKKLQNKIFYYFLIVKAFYMHVMNKSDETIRNLFYLMLFVFWLENLISSLSVSNSIKLKFYYKFYLFRMLIL
jgi:hypothetical protein